LSSDSIFIRDQEIDFFNDLADEVVQKITGQKIYFLRIDKDTTIIDQLYQEAKKLNFHEPIQVYGLVKIITWEDVMEQGQIKESPTVEFYLTKKNLAAIGFETARSVIGQYFIWGEKVYEILSCVSKQLVWGEPDWTFGATMDCKQTVNIAPVLKTIIKQLSSPDQPSIDVNATESTLIVEVTP
jgi:hypothetical protein